MLRCVFVLSLGIALRGFCAAAPPASPGSWVTADTSKRVMVKPWGIPDTSGARGGLWAWGEDSAARWFVIPSWRSQGAAAIAESLLSVRWGSRWEDGPGNPAHWSDCRKYQAGLDPPLFGPEDFWLYACRKPLMGGDEETDYYLLGDGAALTIERAQWRLDFDGDVAESVSTAAYRSLAAAFRKRLGAPVALPKENDDFHSVEWKTGQRFETRQGPLWVYLEDVADPEHVTLMVDRQSAGLRTLDAPASIFSPNYSPGSEVGRPAAVQRELIRALEGVDREVAKALGRSKPTSSDLPVFVRALERMRVSRGESADPVSLATHMWLRALSESLSGGEEKKWDATVAALKSHGVRFQADHDMGWAYCGSLLGGLARRAGSNRWADEGFAEWLENGAADSCVCSDETADRVIARGEEFLRSHPGSTARAAVERAIGEAHETLWSLSQVTTVEGEYTSYSSWLALSGTEHRDQALAHYREALRGAPEGWKLDPLRRRIRRIELGVDTAQRAFYCADDD